ncbi:MAG: alanine racemase, partial [Blautia sp.]|nr:alanine racemase [Blautia sp.]
MREDAKMVAVVKADAYGHGALAIARLVEGYDYLWGFAVATGEEALHLRDHGIKKPILILGLAEEELFPALAKAKVRLAVSTFSLAEAYDRAGKEVGEEVKVHLAIDTGMSRIGFAPGQASIEEIKKISGLSSLTIEGAFTHFARADEVSLDPAYVQLSRFTGFCDEIEAAHVPLPLRHASNSAGILRLPEANLSMARAGITIYGIYPSEEVERDVPIYPVMELKSNLSLVKDVEAGTAVSYGGTFVADKRMRIATVPVGYADGYPRLLSGKGSVLLRGKRAPILGRVCMDQFMVDVSDIPEATIGDEVTLLGRDGEEYISADELGNLSGRFPYELVCLVSHRVPRVYVKGQKAVGAAVGMPLVPEAIVEGS